MHEEGDDESHPLTRDDNERLVSDERRELQASDDAERDEMQACARLEAHEPDFNAIAAALRDTIERQIATTPEGKLLSATYPALLARLVTNIVGNATYTVSNLIEDALAAEKGPQ